MTEPGVLYGGRGGRGGYGPYARFGDLELLLDARRTIAVEGKNLGRIPDFSPHGTNYLFSLSGEGVNDAFQGKLDGIRGQTAFRVADGTGASPGRGPLVRSVTGALTVVCVCQYNALSVFGCVFDRKDAGAGSRVVMALGADQTSLDISSGAGLNSGAGTISAQQPLLIVSRLDGANSLLRIDRGRVNVTGTIGAVNWQSIRIGTLAPAGGGDMNGLLGVLGFYRGGLSTPRILDLENFVNRDWRLGL